MLESRAFMCKLTQSVRKICIFFFSLKKKNQLTASKAPLCSVMGCLRDIDKKVSVVITAYQASTEKSCFFKRIYGLKPKTLFQSNLSLHCGHGKY